MILIYHDCIEPVTCNVHLNVYVHERFVAVLFVYTFYSSMLEK